MRRVLAEIRAEMRAVSPDGKEEGARNDAETSETASNDANDANDAAGLDEALTPETSPSDGKEEETGDEENPEGRDSVGTSVGSRAVSLTDLASLARSNEAAPRRASGKREKKKKKKSVPRRRTRPATTKTRDSRHPSLCAVRTPPGTRSTG